MNRIAISLMGLAMLLAGCGKDRNLSDDAGTGLAPRLGLATCPNAQTVDVDWGRKQGNDYVRWNIQFSLTDDSLLVLNQARKDEAFDSIRQGIFGHAFCDSVTCGVRENPNYVYAGTNTYGAYDGVRVCVPYGKKIRIKAITANSAYGKQFSLAPIADYDPAQNVYEPILNESEKLQMKYKTR